MDYNPTSFLYVRAPGMLPTFTASISVLNGPLIPDTLSASVHRTFENALRVL